MSERGEPVADRSPVRGTAWTLSLGTLTSAACFVIGFALSLLGADPLALDPLRLDLVLSSAAQLQPWGWSMLGVLVLLATPALGLLMTYLEMRRSQPRAALLALAVVGILAAATAVALVAT